MFIQKGGFNLFHCERKKFYCSKMQRSLVKHENIKNNVSFILLKNKKTLFSINILFYFIFFNIKTPFGET